MNRRRFFLTTTVVGAVGIAGCTDSDDTEDDDSDSGEQDPDEATARIEMTGVPDELTDRALNLMDHFSGDHPELWSRPELGDWAYEMHRPDVDGVAYYELEVEPEGYIILATDRHDTPIPNFGTEGTSIGNILSMRADETVATILKIGSQRYIAENEAETPVAHWGSPVFRIENLETLMETEADIEYIAGADETVADDEVTREYEPSVQNPVEFDLPDEVAVTEWGSHQALKDEFESVYAPFLDAQREMAEEDWDAIESAEGAAASTETLDTKADAVNEATPQQLSVHEGTERTASTQADPAVAYPMDQHDPGDTEWAGGSEWHVWYYQHEYQGCAVGCGPVVWALLFGWADRMAEEGPFQDTWWPRWGLYREGGGTGEGEGVLAPQWEGGSNPDDSDDDVDGVQTMINEINDHVEATCVHESFPGWLTSDDKEAMAFTWPHKMGQAAQYFSGRTGTALFAGAKYGLYPWDSLFKQLIAESIAGDTPGRSPTPAAMGEGYYEHYPLAYAWEDNWTVDYFKVNRGQGDWGNTPKTEWLRALTWFAGEIHPDWDTAPPW